MLRAPGLRRNQRGLFEARPATHSGALRAGEVDELQDSRALRKATRRHGKPPHTMQRAGQGQVELKPLVVTRPVGVSDPLLWAWGGPGSGQAVSLSRPFLSFSQRSSSLLQDPIRGLKVGPRQNEHSFHMWLLYLELYDNSC